MKLLRVALWVGIFALNISTEISKLDYTLMFAMLMIYIVTDESQ